MSDQSLRDSLDELASKYEAEARIGGTESYQSFSKRLNNLLAAHPAEPAPVVTDEAVDKALDVAMDDGHNGLDCRPSRNFGGTMRAALEAAAPLLGPRPLLDREALREVLAAWIEDCYGIWDASGAGGESTDSDREADASAEAVMELARPMPTREQIAEALSTATRDMDYTRWETPQGMLPFADAVLALINGTAK